ncbi:uncharacterized protein A4U43_C07F23930 [Asparagus officinalis]|uniref:Uncharacterized protein n=1 Tax=Asparagus officinalis TaxID=4686 RepID=A0A5P1EES7_ASPOF|nr:uncharacterized protein A4U43_C07F23930 [Asparagus officinalis]
MWYDQGQLVNAYLDKFSIIKDIFYSSVAHDILNFLRRDMIGAEGEVFSAEDVDSVEHEGASRKKEGAFYVWTSKEVQGHWQTRNENMSRYYNEAQQFRSQFKSLDMERIPRLVMLRPVGQYQ